MKATEELKTEHRGIELMLSQHIAKEENVLFHMADVMLDANKDSALFEAFDRLERERIGAGKHEAFHALLDRLQDRYLKK